jgi:C4-type Zn-finger protein
VSNQVYISSIDRQPVIACPRCKGEANYLGVQYRHSLSDKEVEYVEGYCEKCGWHDTHIGNCCDRGKLQRKLRSKV